MAEKDTRSAEEKAISDAVDKAVEEHGSLAVSKMLDRKAADVRRIERSGEFPKAMYGKDGKTVTVESKAEQANLGKGWSDKPTDDHRDAAAASSGAVAQTTTRIDAETALRNAAYISNPADSTAHSAAQGSGVMVSDSATKTAPDLLMPVTTVSSTVDPATPAKS